MIKTHYRDYATEAYRLHARLGSAEAYRQRVLCEALSRRAEGGAGLGSPTEAAVAQKESIWRDLEAVERTMKRIALCRNGDCVLRAVKEVYQQNPDVSLRRGDIANRVTKLSIDMPASPRSIYGWLRSARDIFAEERGLRKDDW